MHRPGRATAFSRRQLLRVLGGLVGAPLGIRAVSEHARAAKFDYVHDCYVCQSFEYPHQDPPQACMGALKERVKKRRQGRCLLAQPEEFKRIVLDVLTAQRSRALPAEVRSGLARPIDSLFPR